jgi:hypothetical protein
MALEVTAGVPHGRWRPLCTPDDQNPLAAFGPLLPEGASKEAEGSHHPPGALGAAAMDRAMWVGLVAYAAQKASSEAEPQGEQGRHAGYVIERNRRTHSRYFTGDQLLAGDKRGTG